MIVEQTWKVKIMKYHIRFILELTFILVVVGLFMFGLMYFYTL